MQEQMESTEAGIPNIQLPATHSKPIRSLMCGIAHALTRANQPGVIIVPEKDRFELVSAMNMLAAFVDEDAEPRLLTSDEDLVERVFDETHHQPTIYLEADSMSIETQKEAVDYWTRSSVLRPPLMLFVVRKDPGELMQDGKWIKSFRELLHMPTFRWPDSPSRLKSPKHRLNYFLEVFGEVARTHYRVEPQVDPGARDFLLETFFTQHNPLYIGNYVKLAADLIATMRKFGEEKLTTKVVLSLTDPGHEFALG